MMIRLPSNRTNHDSVFLFLEEPRWTFASPSVDDDSDGKDGQRSTDRSTFNILSASAFTGRTLTHTRGRKANVVSAFFGPNDLCSLSVFHSFKKLSTRIERNIAIRMWKCIVFDHYSDMPLSSLKEKKALPSLSKRIVQSDAVSINIAMYWSILSLVLIHCCDARVCWDQMILY